MAKKILLAPVDPVHDIGLKMVNRGLREAGHQTILLQPDLKPEEIIQSALDNDVDTILLSRTLGYGVAELLARFVDLSDAAGIRDKVSIAIGGMAIRPELAQELGFDAGFGPGTSIDETLAFVEGREYERNTDTVAKQRCDITRDYSYTIHHGRIRELLDEISAQILHWSENKVTPGITRAKIRDELWDVAQWRDYKPMTEFLKEYPQHCDEIVRDFYDKGKLHPKTRRFTPSDVQDLEAFLVRTCSHMKLSKLQHTLQKPVVFNQYGTGCPYMDITHIKVSEAWGADGVVHFDPSWGARTEGFFDGFLTHQEDGTVITPANLNRIHHALDPATIWQVRAHRGLNTPETVVLAGKIGAHMTKINVCYGSLGAGTAPDRLTADGVAAMRYAAQYGLPFDVVTNEELCGVPAHKAFAGMLIMASLAVRLSCRPVLQPLFCYSPEVMISGQMADNYVDFNTAKILALRNIMDAPIWPGAPVGFLTQTEDRVQSSVATSLHGSLAAMLGVDAISIASSDEAYSGGPITVPSKIDTLRAMGEGFRFFGHTRMEHSDTAKLWAEQMVDGIQGTLEEVVRTGSFVQALTDGVLGSKEDGAYPGRSGGGTVVSTS